MKKTRLHTMILFVILSFVSDINGKPAAPNPPVWEYNYQYELFEKIYDQTQAIQRQLTRAIAEELVCPDPWIQISDSCYLIPFHWKKSWLEAEETCERLGGFLATLKTEEEDALVSAYLKSVAIDNFQDELTYIWIGGFDFGREGEWRWVDGQRMNFSNWRISLEDVPLEIRQTENCLDWSDGWNDNNCNRKLHFLCEKYRG